MLRAASCFSGIGAPEVAMPDFQWIWHAEIEPFPAAVMSVRNPESVNLGDVLAPDFFEKANAMGPIDILVGGPPCQAFSVAGLRQSLGDSRGNLSLRWAQINDAINPAFSVTENVPGWLSTKDNAFGCFLGALSGNDGELFPAGDGWSNAGCVIGPRRKLAWRVLDAQYFGLAQRRRRVFVVACPRDGADPCEVLFESKGVQRLSPPVRKKTPVPEWWRGEGRVFNCIDAQYGRKWGSNQWYARGHVIVDGGRPRRATVTEVERAFGFPDGHTNVAQKNDDARYKALGNSMAVPVMRWILKRVREQL